MLAEEQKRRKTFFSHTARSLGLSVRGGGGEGGGAAGLDLVRPSRFTLHLPSAIA